MKLLANSMLEIDAMRAALEKVAAVRKLSNDVAEVIGKALSN